MGEILPGLTRRGFFASAAGALSAPSQAKQRPKIAAVVTEYRLNSHADVIVSRLLGGYEFDGRRREPSLQVVSMYTDQTPKNDMSRGLAEKYKFPIYPTVREALTLGGAKLAVDGVVLIGEHGNYPNNEKGQKLYPRYELYKQVADIFRASGRSVPVFCDKHLSVDWDKAKWMYEQSRELGFPLLAGSSLPLSWRRPPLELPYGTRVPHAVAAFYGGKEAYGFHALEALQCMVERREGGETGIAALQCIEGPAVWKWTDVNPWAARLLAAALQRNEELTPGSPRANVKEPIVFLLEYRDGLKAAVYILNGHVRQCTCAAEAGGRIESTLIWLQSGRPYSHFSSLVNRIEQMMIERRAPYPCERTLLTTGALAALMESSYSGGKRLSAGHLAVRYRAPRESLFARGPVPALNQAPIA
ncbi:MAG: hypothetical protein HYZ57_05845 [Acidobacteria bacterium]|nr:hypothetical protein [Acidobacteriota bacterium]MBI3279348.1 hypothetical protein [Acidobacteriota bacterium]